MYLLSLGFTPFFLFFFGLYGFYFPVLCVLVRTVRVGECAAVDPELSHLETVEKQNKQD